MKVTVTKKDICNGKKYHSSSCPIARAVRRASGQRILSIGTDCFRVGSSGKDNPLPIVARRFIGKFDGGKRVKPFSFVLSDLK